MSSFEIGVLAVIIYIANMESLTVFVMYRVERHRTNTL